MTGWQKRVSLGRKVLASMIAVMEFPLVVVDRLPHNALQPLLIFLTDNLPTESEYTRAIFFVYISNED